MGLKWKPLVVNERGCCFLSEGSSDGCLTFLEQYDPRFFEYAAQVHHEHLKADTRHYASLALRLAYFQALEAHFALLCSAVQAPHFVQGWLASYRPKELKALVMKITNFEPILSVLPLEGSSWRDIARVIYQAQPASGELIEEFCSLWQRLASDYCEEAHGIEYNSIKHGLRTFSGGFSLAIGLQPDRNTPAPPEAMNSLGGNEYGSRFFRKKELSSNPAHFSLTQCCKNWDPEGMAKALMLISFSMRNILTFLKWVNGADPTDLECLRIEKDALTEPWKSVAGVSSFEFGPRVTPGTLIYLTSDQIASAYKRIPGR